MGFLYKQVSFNLLHSTSLHVLIAPKFCSFRSTTLDFSWIGVTKKSMKSTQNFQLFDVIPKTISIFVKDTYRIYLSHLQRGTLICPEGLKRCFEGFVSSRNRLLIKKLPIFSLGAILRQFARESSSFCRNLASSIVCFKICRPTCPSITNHPSS